jgi:hypothetical protein
MSLICPEAVNCKAYEAWKTEIKRDIPAVIKKSETGYQCPALAYVKEKKLGATEVSCVNVELLNNQSKLLRLIDG